MTVTLDLSIPEDLESYNKIQGYSKVSGLLSNVLNITFGAEIPEEFKFKLKDFMAENGITITYPPEVKKDTKLVKLHDN